jgi:hypothetical protein
MPTDIPRKPCALGKKKSTCNIFRNISFFSAAMCSRLLNASLAIIANKLLIIGGFEGTAEVTSRRCVHPFDVISLLLHSDKDGVYISMLHDRYELNYRILLQLLKPWTESAGSDLYLMDVVTRKGLINILTVILAGAFPTFRFPSLSQPIHTHMRTGPQLQSSIDFYRNVCNRNGKHLSDTLSEVCEIIYSPSPLSLLSFGSTVDYQVKLFIPWNKPS